MNDYNKLEYDKILKLVSEFALSDIARERIINSQPVFDAASVSQLLAQTKDAFAAKFTLALNPMTNYDNIEPLITKAKAGAALTPYELNKVRRLILATRTLKKAIDSVELPTLKSLTDNIVVQQQLADSIDKAVLSDDELRDSASEKLYSLRKKIMRTNIALKEKLDSYTRQSGISKYLQDNIVTIRAGRYVLPVKNECRQMVKGLIHDMSASGSTAFIEPFTIVEMNNDLRALNGEEHAEVERILHELSLDVADHARYLNTAVEILIECDIIFARAEYSESIRGIVPEMNTKGRINLINARHPLINKDKVVPINIALGNPESILLISGPNTGGKTVALKSVGLFSLMAYSGIFVPCDAGSELAVFDNIFCDVGDEQSINESLSTFSAHIGNLVAITNSATSKSLVLLDEVGGGTDPSEGAALAVGIIKFFESKKCACIVTTHYSELKEYGVLSNTIQNCCMQFNAETLKPTYRLIAGMPGTSNALKIARGLGLDERIISDAYSSIDETKARFEDVLQHVEEIKNKAVNEYYDLQLKSAQMNSEREQIKKLKAELEERLETLNSGVRKEIRKQAMDYSLQADEIIDELKEKLKQADEAALFEALKERKKLNSLSSKYKETTPDDLPTLDINKIVKGQKVFVKSLSNSGEVIGIKSDKARIKIGGMEVEVPLVDLAAPHADIEKNKINVKVAKKIKEPDEDNKAVSREVMMLGKTVDEAIVELEPIISLLPSKSVLRIVHGKGTGALGRGIQQYLKSNRLVKKFRFGGYGEGDSGVTIVEIK